MAFWEVVDLVDRPLGYLALDPLELSVFGVGDGASLPLSYASVLGQRGARWPRTS